MKEKTSPSFQTNQQYQNHLKSRVIEAWRNLQIPEPIRVENANLTIEDERDIASIFEGVRFDLVNRDHEWFSQSLALQAMAGESLIYYLGTYLLEYCSYFAKSMTGESEDEYDYGFGVSCVDMWGFALFSSLPLAWKMKPSRQIDDIVSEVICAIHREGSVASGHVNVIEQFNLVATEIIEKQE